MTRTGLLRIIRRRWWVLLLTTVAVTGVAVAASNLEKRAFETTAVLYVPSGAEAGVPGNAYEASHLAASYVEVIMNDEQLHRAISAGTGVPTDDVADRLSARQLGTTALLEITYSGAESAAEASSAMTAATAHLVRGSAAIPAGSLVALEIEPEPTESRRYLGSAAWLGAVLGLIFGCGLIALLERSDRRIDSALTLRLLLGVPATDLDKATPATVDLAVARWVELTTSARRPLRVACVPTTRSGQRTAARAAATLTDLLPTTVVTDPTTADGTTSAVVTATTVPNQDGRAEHVAVSSDAVVLIVARGSREQDVLDSSRHLQDLGVSPLWSLVLDRARR